MQLIFTIHCGHATPSASAVSDSIPAGMEENWPGAFEAKSSYEPLPG
jgi:hypothetical protein